MSLHPSFYKVPKELRNQFAVSLDYRVIGYGTAEKYTLVEWQLGSVKGQTLYCDRRIIRIGEGKIVPLDNTLPRHRLTRHLLASPRFRIDNRFADLGITENTARQLYQSWRWN
jgi:hypothetical protein